MLNLIGFKNVTNHGLAMFLHSHKVEFRCVKNMVRFKIKAAWSRINKEFYEQQKDEPENVAVKFQYLRKHA